MIVLVVFDKIDQIDNDRVNDMVNTSETGKLYDQ